jgi:tRNA dimethylallyltransferase
MTAGPGERPSFQGWFLVGPTASGKTAAAHRLALRLGADVLSADSMLVYRGLDIGTAKPDAAMRREVRYWGVDVADPGESFSAGRFRDVALEAFRAAEAAGRPLLVVGGTGLYIKALTHGLTPTSPPDPASRARWERLFREEGVAGLQRALRARSDQAFRAVADPGNPRRLIRALERLADGIVESSPAWAPPDAGPAMPGLVLPRPLLHARIEARVRRMYADGLLDEVRRLLDSGMWPGRTACQAIGYTEAAAVIRGEWGLEDAVAATAAATRRLAKRQMTWFRRQARVAWIEVDEGMTADQVADAVGRVWDANGPVPVWRG